MTNRIKEIEGIDKKYVTNLDNAGIQTTDDLLKAAGAPQERKALATKVGVDAGVMLDWVNRADLMRVKGIGTEFADLLEESGVDSTKELAARVPARLHERMEEANSKKRLVSRLPTENEVEKWITDAKKLPQVVVH